MNRKICVVTGTRSEYGLLRWVMDGIRGTSGLELQLAVTGMHLSPEFGLTFRDIETDGFTIDAKVEMLLSSDTPVGISKSTALGLMGFATEFARLRPDVLLLLGDRFETLAAATAAMFANIPIAHLHGGEVTEGAFDEAIRHSVTKMSHLHFVAAEEYRRRVIQLGEAPERVFLVGGLGVDVIKRTKLLDRTALEASIGFSLGGKSLLVTFHPVTLEAGGSEHEMAELLAALNELRDTRLIFTMPNADTGGRGLSRMVRDFVRVHANSAVFTSLGQVRYLSCLQYVDGVVGNSSSGITEAPTMRRGTVNIGDRQNGRLKASSVIDCRPRRDEIGQAIKRLYSRDFQRSLRTIENPYGDGGASERIVDAVGRASLDGLLRKRFYDVLPPRVAQ